MKTIIIEETKQRSSEALTDIITSPFSADPPENPAGLGLVAAGGETTGTLDAASVAAGTAEPVVNVLT
jgi:hypothetical protein